MENPQLTIQERQKVQMYTNHIKFVREYSYILYDL